MNKSGIEWTDYTWNPVTGCLHGCDYCYAREIANRPSRRRAFPDGFKPTYRPERLDQPTKVRRESSIFVCSMADLFGSWVPEPWISQVLEIVRSCPSHTFQFLTKNPARLSDFNPWPGNTWVGATATNQAQADIAVHAMTRVEAPVRFISCEPLLDRIDLDGDFWSWIIVGACTGRKRRQPERAWIEVLTAKARAIGAALFYKPNLRDVDQVREFPTYAGYLF